MTTNLLIILLGAVFLGGVTLVAHRRYGPGYDGGGESSLWKSRDRLRDWWYRGRDEGAPEVPQPAPVIIPDQRRLPPPPPPPPSRNGNGRAPGPDPEPGQGFGGAQSDLMHAIGSVVARACGGDVRDVRRGVKTLAAAGDLLAQGTSQLGTRLAEPDRHYGQEIWEPLSMAGAQFRSGALHLGVTDANVTSLLNTSVGELAESPRMAPHASQLNGPV